MKLYLMRHGEAASVFDDLARPLTKNGCAQVASILSQSPAAMRSISHIMHSDTARTSETAEIMSKGLNVLQVTLVPHSLSESAQVDECLSDLAVWEEDTLLVSHFPFLNELLRRLVDEESTQAFVNFTTATLVALDRNSEGRWVIDYVLQP